MEDSTAKLIKELKQDFEDYRQEIRQSLKDMENYISARIDRIKTTNGENTD